MSTDEEFLTGVGAKIKIVRKDKGLNQTKLAALCDFDKASLSRIESGKTNLTALTLKKIADALDVGASHFFKDGQGT